MNRRAGKLKSRRHRVAAAAARSHSATEFFDGPDISTHFRRVNKDSFGSSPQPGVQLRRSVRQRSMKGSTRLVQLAPTDSDNPVLAAIAKRYQALKFDGPKPKLVYVEPSKLTTTAAYDVKTHTIKADKSTRDEVKLWDNILFEAQNARNQSKFKAVSKGRGKGSKMTFSEFGAEYASVEFDSFMKYYRELVEVEKEIGDRKKLPDQAQKALKKGDEYAGLPQDEAREKFIGSAHKKGASGKAGLSSADLYTYESVEESDLGTIRSRLTNVARPIYKYIGGISGDTAQKLRHVHDSFAWPNDKAKRPHALNLLLNSLIATAADLKTKHPDKSKYLADFITQMEKMRLSNAAQKVAKAAYEAST